MAGLKKKNRIRRQGKGRRVYLGAKICSISCSARCFASVYLEETVEFNLMAEYSSWLDTPHG